MVIWGHSAKQVWRAPLKKAAPPAGAWYRFSTSLLTPLSPGLSPTMHQSPRWSGCTRRARHGSRAWRPAWGASLRASPSPSWPGWRTAWTSPPSCPNSSPCKVLYSHARILYYSSILPYSYCSSSPWDRLSAVQPMNPPWAPNPDEMVFIIFIIFFYYNYYNYH